MSSESSASTRRPRADAERNRRRVLDAASQVFASQGPAATLDEVARAAGVGIGTIYRKFCDKQALLDALFDDKVAMFMRPALDATRVADPGEAFRSYLLGMIEVLADDRSMVTVLFGPGRPERVPTGVSKELVATADGLIEAAIAAGELREGFTRQDTVVLSAMVGQIAGVTRKTDPGLWRRYAQLVVDGTRPNTHEPLAPHPMPFRDTAEAIGRML